MKRFFLMPAWGLAALWLASPAAAQVDCHDLLWDVRATPQETRALTPGDLVRLRDVGPANNELLGHHLFTLSPDGRSVAFQLRRANLATNSYCLAMIVQSLSGDASPVIVDRGGDMLQYSARLDGQAGRDTGIPMVITPQWSRDGRWIAFLKKVDGRIQLWRAWTDGHGSDPVVAIDQDVIGFQILDPTHILVRVQNGLDQDEPGNEALRGYHYDARFFPVARGTPLLVPPSGGRLLTIDLTTGKLQSAPTGASLLNDDDDGGEQTIADGRTARWIRIGSGVPEIRDIQVTDNRGRSTLCPEPLCGTLVGPLWWRSDGRAVRFLKRTGWGGGDVAIVEWRTGSTHVRTLYESSDQLIDCQPLASGDPVCLRETSTQPRHLVVIDLAHGRVRTIADFNPEFRAFALGSVHRINLTSSAGIRTFADVVLPVGYEPWHRYPLIVVQYRSHGFLRGGVGDEFPIQAYANQGYAVLSVERPAPVGTLSRPRDYVEVDRLGLLGFSDMHSQLSVIEQGVRRLIEEGIADPRKVGISGLSNGATMVQFAAVHSTLFAAGAASACCWEPDQDALLGPAAQSLYRRIGWPGLIDDASDFWSQISLVRNASRVAFPILFDQPDDEYRAGLASYVALREAHKPGDLFVFPDEHHVKWQPAHRLAAYQRSIDWFNFWLLGQFPADPHRREEVDRWQAMKRDVQIR